MKARHLFSFAAAAVLSCIAGMAAAAPLPSPDVPIVTGTWQDSEALLLPPGIGRFETYSDQVTFYPDGSFTQTICKAAGRTKTSGRYRLEGSRLTLSDIFLSGTLRQYEVVRDSSALHLTPIAPTPAAMFGIQRVAE